LLGRACPVPACPMRRTALPLSHRLTSNHGSQRAR
jgi:hypothetical protein